MKRHARHHHRLASRLAAPRQGDVEQPGSLLRIGIKQLVEVAHAVKQQRVGVAGFEAKVLGHHGRVPGKRCRKGRGYRILF